MVVEVVVRVDGYQKVSPKVGTSSPESENLCNKTKLPYRVVVTINSVGQGLGCRDLDRVG